MPVAVFHHLSTNLQHRDCSMPPEFNVAQFHKAFT